MQQQCKTPRCSSANTTMMLGVAVQFRSTPKAKELQLQCEIPAGGFAFKFPKVFYKMVQSFAAITDYVCMGDAIYTVKKDIKGCCRKPQAHSFHTSCCCVSQRFHSARITNPNTFCRCVHTHVCLCLCVCVLFVWCSIVFQIYSTELTFSTDYWRILNFEENWRVPILFLFFSPLTD